jgi:hypothetical protein
MPGITSIEVEAFRCFERLRVEGLTPVSLIVGKNNAGKTALLEALEAVASERSPFVLYRASFERGEYRLRKGPDEDHVELDISHWFHGHRVEESSTFSLRATGDRERHVFRAVQSAPAPPAFAPGAGPRLTLLLAPPAPGGPHSSGPPTYGQNVNGVWVPDGPSNLPLTPDGFLGAGPASSFAGFGSRLSPPVGFVTTGRLVPSELARLWSTVALTPAEDRTLEALRIVEPAVDRVAISESYQGAIARVLLRGAPGPVPLGSLGEGVSRILTLGLNLSVVQGGFLFLDEIENGLHWSVMPKVWRFLTETARALDIQVFATTHSKDCLEGLADLHRTHPTLAQNVSVHRLEGGRETSVRFDADRIAEFVDMDLEAR